MDLCVLGLLMIAPRSSYELRAAFASSLSLFYSSSLGSIQAALKRLAEAGLVELAAEEEGGRRKKTWRPTAAGRAWFRKEMRAPLPEGRLEEAALVRFHFLGLLKSRGERRAVLRLVVASVEAALRGLEELRAGLDLDAMPAAWREVARYQVGTLDYGLEAHRQGLAWFRARLEEEGGGAE